MNKKKTLGQVLKSQRKFLGLTQRELALKLDVKGSHVAYLEKGRRRPSLGLLSRIANALAAGIAETERYGYELLEGEMGLRFDAPFAISSKRVAARGRTSILPAAPDEIAKRAAA